MKKRDLTKLLIESLQLQEELYEFCTDCIEKFYPEDKDFMLERFEDGVNAFEWNGNIQGIHILAANLEMHKEGREASIKHHKELTEFLKARDDN